MQSESSKKQHIYEPAPDYDNELTLSDEDAAKSLQYSSHTDAASLHSTDPTYHRDQSQTGNISQRGLQRSALLYPETQPWTYATSQSSPTVQRRAQPSNTGCQSPHITPPPTFSPASSVHEMHLHSTQSSKSSPTVQRRAQPSNTAYQSPHITPPPTFSPASSVHEMHLHSTQSSKSPQQTITKDNFNPTKLPDQTSPQQSPQNPIQLQYLSSPASPHANQPQFDYSKMVVQEKKQRPQHKNIAEYIRAIGGVPVLPPVSKNFAMDSGKVRAGDNLAFRRHVANHRAFDTLNSFKSCEKCPICRAMDEGAISLEEAAELPKHSHKPALPSETISGEAISLEEAAEYPKHFHKPALPSKIPSGEAFEDFEQDVLAELEKLDDYVSEAAQEEIYKDNGTDINTLREPDIALETKQRAQVIQDFGGANEAELTVKQGEILQVLQRKNVWWQCANSEGDVGWVPVCYIYALPD